MGKTDFLAIGDIATDAYIRLKDASVHCDLRHEHCQICLRFGEKIPYEFVEIVAAAGNAPNAAVAASRLGLSAGLISDVGDDEAGRECLKNLADEKIQSDLVKIHPQDKTSHHFVLWFEDERTILTKHEPFQYALPDFEPPQLIYLSSIAANSEKYHEEIANFLKKNAGVRLVFQPGTFQLTAGLEKTRYFYERAELVVVNESEAKKIMSENAKIIPLLNAMKNLGPKIVVITAGRNGSYLHDGSSVWHVPIYENPNPPYERTGAGDATAGTMATALLLGKEPIEALMWGTVNASSVVQDIGPQKGLLKKPELEERLKNPPTNFKPEKLS